MTLHTQRRIPAPHMILLLGIALVGSLVRRCQAAGNVLVDLSDDGVLSVRGDRERNAFRVIAATDGQIRNRPRPWRVNNCGGSHSSGWSA